MVGVMENQMIVPFANGTDFARSNTSGILDGVLMQYDVLLAPIPVIMLLHVLPKVCDNKQTSCESLHEDTEYSLLGLGIPPI